MDKKLKMLLFAYGASALCAALCISGAILSNKYISSLSATLGQFQNLKVNSVKMKDATRDMEAILSQTRSLAPSYHRPEEMEGSLLTTLDSIKSRMKGADISITHFEKKGSEISIPVVITGTIRDYTEFVNFIGYLQSLRFPFFFTSDILISGRSGDTGEVVDFKINGILKSQSITAAGGP
ncbi:MAG: hypothetical protein FJ139_08385 [Deltaproteobacteria bacterium]|nr:hypothetical protein [Deltaproteobacteria bacterium]